MNGLQYNIMKSNGIKQLHNVSLIYLRVMEWIPVGRL